VSKSELPSSLSAFFLFILLLPLLFVLSFCREDWIVLFGLNLPEDYSLVEYVGMLLGREASVSLSNLLTPTKVAVAISLETSATFLQLMGHRFLKDMSIGMRTSSLSLIR
jgi:hypothetical protein